MTIFNPFPILGISSDSTKEQVEAAFRDKARTAHPDRGGSNEAFNLLMKAKLYALDEISNNEAYKIKCKTCNDTGKITKSHGPHSLKMACPDCG